MEDRENGIFVHYGKPLEREEDLTRKKAKLAVEQGEARRVPPWKQEVTDAEGRRRFHGAFTGGFSAGYYNTVGSKEGWAPKAFTSSRNQRAQKAQQSIDDFLDDDELEELRSKDIGTSAEYDTFGFTAAEVARRNAEKEVGTRVSAIPGPVPDEIVIPSAQSIGVKLLMKMGWRRGRVVGPRHFTDASVARREGRKAIVAFASSSQADYLPKKVYGAQLPPGQASPAEEKNEMEDDKEIDLPQSTPDFVLHPKNDVYGLGFDPHKNAPEFKEVRQARSDRDDRIWMPGRVKDSQNTIGKARNFGSRLAMDVFHDEDEEVYDTVVADVDDREEDVMRVTKPQPRLLSNEDCITGFLPASSISSQLKLARLPQVVVPLDFDTRITFKSSITNERGPSRVEPFKVQPPSDPQMVKLIDGLATFVGKIGPRFEELSKEKHAGNPQFSFLVDGPGHEYYLRRLWEEQTSNAGKEHEPFDPKRKALDEKLDAGQRSSILGETPLPREEKARLQERASTATSSLMTVEDPNILRSYFKGDPYKQERFEKYRTEKLIGGIKHNTGTGNISRAQYEREILEFDNIMRNLEGQPFLNVLPKEMSELTAMMNNRFTPATLDPVLMVPDSEPGISNRHSGLPLELHEHPRREESSWRPSSMLCKRFNLADPFAGKPPPTTNSRSQTDSFVLNASASEELRKLDGPMATNAAFIAESTPQINEEAQAVKMITEIPVDLYKAIFSDDDEEGEDNDGSKEDKLEPTPLVLVGDKHGVEVIAKQSVAAQAALNRLAAGDFLESLGKELGLRVPVEKPRVDFNIDEKLNRPIGANVFGVEKSDANTSNGRDAAMVFESLAPSLFVVNATKTDRLAASNQRDKASRWGPIDDHLDLEQHKRIDHSSTPLGIANSEVQKRKSEEAEYGSRRQETDLSKSSSSEKDSDTNSETYKTKSRRSAKRSKQDSDSDSESQRRRLRRDSKKSKRSRDEKGTKRRHRSRHEKHKRKEDEKDEPGRKKRRHLKN